MLDMSWGEIMVIGAAALIVIGPKDLPKALRTLGQMTSKLRRMASDFQGQFNEALREAELDEVKQQLQGVNSSVSTLNKGFNPIQTIRDELKGAVEAPVSDASKPSAPESGEGTAQPAAAQAPGETALPAPADPVIDLPPPPDVDPAEAIAESLKREAEAKAKAENAASPSTQDKADIKAE